jgi:hypothetical protein
MSKLSFNLTGHGQRCREVDLADCDLILLLTAACAVPDLLCLPACFHAWTLCHTKDPAANDPIARPWKGVLKLPTCCASI